MDREGRIPAGLVAGLIIFVLVIGALAYYAGRFGRRGPAASPADSLPPPAAPAPAVVEAVPTPADIPPTVTPAVPAVVERTSRTQRVLVQRSTQIVVPVAPVAVTPTPGIAAPARRIVVEVVNTPPPLPSPTVPELEQGDEEGVEPEEVPEEPEPEPTPEVRSQAGGRPVSI